MSLRKIGSCLCKIREGMKYLRKSQGQLLNFGRMVIQLDIYSQDSLCAQMSQQENSTHRMLELIFHYKKALRDSNFQWLPDETE